MSWMSLIRHCRTPIYYAAAFAGALVNLGTSDCSSTVPVTVQRVDTYAVGRAPKRYLVRAPLSDSIEVSVNSGYAVTWLNPPPAIADDAGARYATFRLESFDVDCRYLPCDHGPCANPCEQFEIEVTRPATAASDDFTLTVTAGNRIGCDDSIVELKVEPE